MIGVNRNGIVENRPATVSGNEIYLIDGIRNETCEILPSSNDYDFEESQSGNDLPES